MTGPVAVALRQVGDPASGGGALSLARAPNKMNGHVLWGMDIGREEDPYVAVLFPGIPKRLKNGAKLDRILADKIVGQPAAQGPVGRALLEKLDLFLSKPSQPDRSPTGLKNIPAVAGRVAAEDMLIVESRVGRYEKGSLR